MVHIFQKEAVEEHLLLKLEKDIKNEYIGTTKLADFIFRHFYLSLWEEMVAKMIRTLVFSPAK